MTDLLRLLKRARTHEIVAEAASVYYNNDEPAFAGELMELADALKAILIVLEADDFARDFVNIKAKIAKYPISDSESDPCEVCGGSGKIGQMGADNTDIFEIDCYYCHPEPDDD